MKKTRLAQSRKGAKEFAAHYHWAGLDFMFDRDGMPVFIEANRASHMLSEYLGFFGDERPFELTARVMNRAGGVPCLLWRRGDPFPDADEDACFIGKHLSAFLERSPVVCNVEDNQEPRETLVARDGAIVRPGSIFRWWYALPWSYERAGTAVINPNCLWLVVRDKLLAYQTLAQAATFRVPRAFAVESNAEAQGLLEARPHEFADGFVLKPRVGWGGQGVQVGDPGDLPLVAGPNYLLSERIIPPAADGAFWEVRAFVMAGEYLGGIRHVSRSPLTNYWQGGRPAALDAATSAALAPAALEAVQLIDEAAEAIDRLPEPPASVLTQVVY